MAEATTSEGILASEIRPTFRGGHRGCGPEGGSYG